ncbi:GMC oxidoreductase [Microbacterium yannicii]|uniref:GMC oxidoreductase n=1 Tax=Microbacterium yannicii TaxID=671622 RepID=UPI0002F6E8E9|nr:GMC oxidoreductase [Microbacterium yannicii]
MTVLAAHETPTGPYDCCVVGTGPVGLAFAIESAEAGSRVLLLDAGDTSSGGIGLTSAESARTEITDPARHAPLDLTLRRGLGGTSWLWGGRCVAFEPIDFERRDYVPSADWPLTFDDVVEWYEPAARHLDCGAGVFRSPLPDWPGLSDFRMSNLERWARQPRLARGLGARATAHPRIDAVFGARLDDIAFDADGAVSHLVVVRGGRSTEVQAGAYVLALGGLETTRLLLGVQRRMPHAFGGVDGPLGRYYMGHATGSVADVVLDDPGGAADLDFVRDEHDTYIRRRFTLAPEAQRRHGVLNTAFYLDNPPFYEDGHRSATLSAVFLAIAVPIFGRRVLAEGIRLRHVGPRPYRIRQHLANVLRRPWRAMADVAGILSLRYLSRVRKPGFLLRNEGGRYALHYHSEQLPNPESRMSLRTNADGVDVLHLDYRYLEEDIDSLLRAHELLDAELRSAGLGHLEYLADDAAAVRGAAWDQATDGFHSIGTTRMSADPAHGVVDRDCRVHGIANLYIASSSVFPTSAEANPTFFAAVLAVRLAHHLRPARASPAP